MDVIQKQCLLKYLKFYTGAVDGSWGRQSQAAAEAFQRVHFLTVDGIVGPITEKEMIEAVYNGELATGAEQDDADKKPTPTGTFWDDIKWWSRSEFACRCGEYHAPYCNGFPVEPDETLVRVADRVREHFGRPAHRSSAIRCERHNADQKNAATNSKHKYGKALDFYVENVSGAELLAYVKAQPEIKYAYIISGQYVHMDV